MEHLCSNDMAQCITPYYVDTPQGRVPVPCGKCPDCVTRRASHWSFRLMQEDKISISSYFITFTYDTEHVPISRNLFLSLRRKDLQLFYKRLRKAHRSDYPIKYYSVGEYGGRKHRPHYHSILFNADIKTMFEKQELLALEYSDYDGKVHVRCKQWPHGTTTVGKVSGASVGYVLKYLTKSWKPYHINDDREPPQATMSKGLGENYLGEYRKFWHGVNVVHNGEECIQIKYGKRRVNDSNIVTWHKRDLDNRYYINLEENKRASMPRFYKERIYTEQQRKRLNHFAVIKAQDIQNKILQEYLMRGETEEDMIRDRNEARVASFKIMESRSKQYEKI